MLEPNLSPYAPIVDRPVVRWPNNARVALWVAPNVEYMDFMPAPNDGHGGFFRNVYSRTPRARRGVLCPPGLRQPRLPLADA